MSLRAVSPVTHLSAPPWASLIAVILAGCMPELPRPGVVSSEEAPSAFSPYVTLSPSASLDAAPQVFRAYLRLPAGSVVDLDRVGLFEGELGAGHLRQIVHGELSKALSERRIPALTWVEEPPADDMVIVVAPTVPLNPGEVYSLASGVPETVETLRIAQEASPFLSRIWPPLGLSATTSFGVWCGPNSLPLIADVIELEPDGPAGTLRRDAVDGIGHACVRFESTRENTDDGPFIGPPTVAVGGGGVGGLDPRPFMVEAPPVELRESACAEGEVGFGPGCASVSDDRILVHSPEMPLLWAVGGEGVDLVAAAGPGEPFLISELMPSAVINLKVIAIDVAGRPLESTFSSTTLDPMPHVIINEVLANPVGAEPAQEWVELYNDGTVAAQLSGYILEDVGGQTPLPTATLLPGAFALVVNETFQEDDELDPSPAEGTLLLRVPKLGKNGLANGGEPLRLRDFAGKIVSRVPALKVSRPGMSLCRTTPRAPDGLAGTFVASYPDPGRENMVKGEVE